MELAANVKIWRQLAAFLCAAWPNERWPVSNTPGNRFDPISYLKYLDSGLNAYKNDSK